MVYFDFFTLTQDGATAIVSFTVPELDDVTIACMGDALIRVADRVAGSTVHLDMARVDYLSSTAIGRILAFFRILKEADRELILTNVRPFPHQVMEITGVAQLLRVTPMKEIKGPRLKTAV